MTLFEPCLMLNRLVVLYRGKPAYDEKFSSGINIIRGENSSGKSTITDLIFFALGGEIGQWKRESAQCDYTLAELFINGSPVTVRREIDEKSKRPLDIFWGDYEAATASVAEDWQRYPFQRSESKESFSQALFRAMKMPEVRGDKLSNITMHQILRLIYADQMTPVNRLFRFEQFDTSLHRNTIGDLLCGVYSNELYEKQLELEYKKKELQLIASKLKNIVVLLGEADQDINIEKLEIKLDTIEKQRLALYEELKILKESTLPDKKEEDEPSGVAKNIRDEIINIKTELIKLRDIKEQSEFEIEDTRQFVNVIQERLASLYRSDITRESLGEIYLEFCPICLSKLPEQSDADTCRLCKTVIDEEKEKANLLRLQQEIEMQILESNTLMKKRENELKEINLKMPSLISRIKELGLRYDSIGQDVISDQGVAIEELIRKIGYLDRSIKIFMNEQSFFL